MSTPRSPLFSWLVALAVAALLALFAPRRAAATDLTVGGSAQIDEHFVATHPKGNPQTLGFTGLTEEFALKLAVDVSESLSANVKLCYGCHGFEADMAYFDYRVADELNFRLGRFSPSFGSYNLRHDPGNHRLSDKPLAYDMGRMLRLRDWNMGVLPAPFPDNGVEIDGTHWAGGEVQLDYAAYAVTGFRADATSTDLDFSQSRSLYYVDNNALPTVGARASLTGKLGEGSDVTGGVSGQYGTFDPDRRLSYAIFGADLVFRLRRTNLRFEWLARRERYDSSDQSRFKYEVSGMGTDFFMKHGAYAELEVPVTSAVDVIGRVDGLYRAGNVLTDSALSARSSVLRWTLGTAIALERNLRIKASTELWRFSDAAADGKRVEVSMHLAAVATF